MAHIGGMDNEELITRLNTLQAQNIALMQMVAALANQSGLDIRAEFQARCAIFSSVIDPNTDEDARAIQRAMFAKVERTILGDRNAIA